MKPLMVKAIELGVAIGVALAAGQAVAYCIVIAVEDLWRRRHK